jgi:hypothetical protein
MADDGKDTEASVLCCVLHILVKSRGVRVELLEMIGDGSVVICLGPPDLEPRLNQLNLEGEVQILVGNDGGLLLRVKLDVLGWRAVGGGRGTASGESDRVRLHLPLQEPHLALELPDGAVQRIFCILELVVDVCCLRKLVIDDAAVGELAEDDGVERSVISPPSAGTYSTERVKGARLVWALVLISTET